MLSFILSVVMFLLLAVVLFAGKRMMDRRSTSFYGKVFLSAVFCLCFLLVGRMALNSSPLPPTAEALRQDLTTAKPGDLVQDGEALFLVVRVEPFVNDMVLRYYEVRNQTGDANGLQCRVLAQRNAKLLRRGTPGYRQSLVAYFERGW